MAATKISRKQLLKEPDEFLSLSAKGLAFISAHRQRIAMGAGALIVLVVVLTVIHVIGERNRLKALDMLNAAMATYQQIASAEGPEKGYAAVADQYRLLMAEYSDTDAGRLGRWVFAGNCLAAAKYDEAIDLYQAAVAVPEGLPTVRAGLYTGLGTAYMGKTQWSEAAAAFEKALSDSGALAGSDVLFQLGLAYDRLGQPQKSREVLERLVSEHADSLYVGMARERLRLAPQKSES